MFLGQRRLSAVSDELCALAHEASACFSEDRIADGAVALSRLEEMLEETFEGSMPAFIAAFSKSKKLSKTEVDQLQALIDSYEED